MIEVLESITNKSKHVQQISSINIKILEFK